MSIGISSQDISYESKLLNESHQKEIFNHFLELSDEDLKNRFLYKADVDDINNYINKIDFKKDKLIGLFKCTTEKNKSLIAIGHLMFFKHEKESQLIPDISISVVMKENNTGADKKIMDLAIDYLRKSNYKQLKMNWLKDDERTKELAKKYNFTMSEGECSTLNGLLKI